MIKAIFFDVDGTLVSFKTHKVPESTIKAIELVRQKGIKVFMATGRHLSTVDNTGNLEFDGYITLNGGLCLDINRNPIYKKPIEKSDVISFINFLDENPIPCLFVREKDLFINFVNDNVHKVFKMLNFPEQKIKKPEEEIDIDVFQMVSFFIKDEEPQILKHIPNCEATRWNPMFSDIVPQGSSKKIGIEKTLEHYGIKQEETMAFGDGGNDIPMLEYVEIGVAMGNADDEVKSSANYITDSVDDDGIYKALEHFQVI